MNNVKDSIEFDIRDGRYNDQILVLLLEVLMQNIEVTQLTIWMPGNYISNVGFLALVNSLKHFRELRSLIVNFDWNFDLNNSIIDPFCKVVSSLHHLEILTVKIFRHTYVNRKGEDAIIAMARQHDNIRTAYINNNKLFPKYKHK